MKVGRTRRNWYVVLGVFVTVGLFSFLVQRFDSGDEVDAANMGAFDPGYIMSDYQMGNYTSMSEGDIQAFLNAKNPCGNRDWNYYVALSANRNYSWHWADGHFVCLSQERFGYNDNEIGSGETAAHIIWQAAQDYRINPQVLLVLLQKETGLITDPIPNNGDYRKATGFGCPDTAACSSQYYGFRNQVRNAAALFREVLNGGWTNYPLGNNYVRYSPNAACGGTIVNIRSRATSALYRYTPYQPNAAALSSSYGYGDGCSAYGNRNFYSYFQDWFGGITGGVRLIGSYTNMTIPRLMYVESGSRYIEPNSGDGKIRSNTSFEYFTSLSRKTGELCLSLSADRNCYIYDDLDEIDYTETSELAVPRMLTTKNDTKTIDVKNKKFGDNVASGEDIIFNYKQYVNDRLCLKEEVNSDCIQYSELEELPEVKVNNMVVPRELYVRPGAKVVNAQTGITRNIDSGKKIYFNKASTWKGKLCLQASDYNGTFDCVVYNDYLVEINDVAFSSMDKARYLEIKEDASVFDLELWMSTDKISKGTKLFFDKKTNIDGKLCLQSSKLDPNGCIYYDKLEELSGYYTKMAVARYLWLGDGAIYYNTSSNQNESSVLMNDREYFTEKIYIDGKLCLRSQSDADDGVERCLWYSSLRE